MNREWRKAFGSARTRAVIAVAIVAALAGATAAGVWASRHGTAATARPAAAHGTPAADQTAAEPSPTASAATAQPTASASPAPPTPAQAAPAVSAAAPAHFGILPPGAALPSSAQCAAWVRAQALPEIKGVNRPFNQTTGQRLSPGFFPASDDQRANTLLGVRVDGAFTGTTQQVLRWAACKWGIDEDIAFAQAAKESWWQQTAEGDWGTSAAACPPGHGLGADGKPGQCPQSYGILQNRYSIEQSSWPGMYSSTAMNADTAYAIWRACFEGFELWLNTVDRGGPYAAGDAWGCVGRWFSGRWHTAPGEQYAAAVQSYEQQRIWEQATFRQP